MIKSLMQRLPDPDGPAIDFTIYPSPVAGTTFHIFDIQGRSIATGPNTPDNTTTIDISTPNAALYYIRINRNGEILETLSFVKL